MVLNVQSVDVKVLISPTLKLDIIVVGVLVVTMATPALVPVSAAARVCALEG